MTLPSERTRSIHKARKFLRMLLDPKQTPRVPKWIRKEAYWCLRHFPSAWEVERMAKHDPCGYFEETGENGEN